MKLNQKMKYKVMENVSVRKGALLMKRMLSTLIVAIMMLTVVVTPQMASADARGIKVIPYPRTAGKMASYKISFNVTRPLEANKDSITVTLPKETVVPDYISSSVISINPKKLIGTDYRLNFATGGITFTNPLREGDMIKASYTYEASEEYTMMPKAVDVKFYDRCFNFIAPGPAGPDSRNNNGVFDPGEWVYEDRDHNSRISPGDRRLTVVKGVLAAGNDARQNSIVAAGDGDCAQDALMLTYLNPLVPLSIIRLTMLDHNKDGIYNDGDFLFDDRDQSGTISIGDNMIAGIAELPPKTVVQSNDPDCGTGLTGRVIGSPTLLNFYTGIPGVGIYRHVDDGDTLSGYDSGEAIYLDVTGSSTYNVDAGDVRYTAVTVNRNGITHFYEAGSFVLVGDFDMGTRLIDFKQATGEEEGYLDINLNAQFDPGEPIYRNGTGRITFYAGPAPMNMPQPGDVRLSSWTLAAYGAGSMVVPTDADINTSIVSFNTNPIAKPESYVAIPNALGVVVPLQIAVNPVFPSFTSAHYTQGIPEPNTQVSPPWPVSLGAVVPPTPTASPAIGNLQTPFPSWIYRDNDSSGTITFNDERLTEVRIRQGKDVIIYSAGSIVKAGELDTISQFGLTSLPLSQIEVSPLPPTGVMRHAENIKINNKFDPREYLYNDMNADGIVDIGDYRLSPTGLTSFGNKAIQNGFPLMGETLTRGWARIENKVIVPYAQAGTKTAMLEATPINILPTLVPPTPPTNLSATYLTLPGGNTPLTNSGTWYIRVSAVNMYGEGEPSEPMAINFAPNSTVNSVKLSWRPIPFAVSYRIYKSKNDAYFPPSSLLAEVETPVCEYVDRGTTITEGGLPFPYKASFVTLWRTRGGMETELVEYNCADYEIDLASGMVKFRRALRPYEIVLADYKFAPAKTPLGADLDPCKTVGHKDEHVYVDTQRGIGKLLHAPAVDPKIDPLNYCFRLWRAPLIDPKNPYLLREGSDYTINYQTGDIQFSTHVVTAGDIITADYDSFEEVAGESLVEAISTGITQAQCSSPVIPESYTIYRAVALRSAPQIKVTGGAYGWQIVFTTPVDVSIDPDNDPTTPDIVMTLNRPGRQLTATNKGAVRNPEKAGVYQLWVNTSQEQTPILSEPYDIIADKDLNSVSLNIVSPQGTVSGNTITVDNAKAGQPISVVTQLMAGSNGLPNVYVKFEIISTPQPQSSFTSPSLVQTNDQGLASVVLSLSATAGTTAVKVYLQDKPSLSWTININTGPVVKIKRIVVSPPNIALTPNSQQQFTALAFDEKDTVIQNVQFTWAADKGVINPNGLYTAPIDSNTTDKVYARAYGIEGIANVQVTQRPQRIEVTPQSANIAAGSTQLYKAQAYDSYGNPMNIAITWTVKPGTTGLVVGKIDSEGLFTANPGTKGDSIIEACSAGTCGTAKINVIDNGGGGPGGCSKIEINPKSLTMTIGGTFQFKAKAYDANNQEIVGSTFTWAVTPSDYGFISTDGLLTPAKTGTMVVMVSACGKQDVCLVTVTEAPARIEITPAIVDMEFGETKTFTAIAYSASNTTIQNAKFTWELNPASGFAAISNTTDNTASLMAIGTEGSKGILKAKLGVISSNDAVITIKKKITDITPPEIIFAPPGCVPTNMMYPLEVKVTDANGVKEVLIDGVSATNKGSGVYGRNVNIMQGNNNFKIKAVDMFGNEITKDISIIGSCPRILVITQGSLQGKLTKDCGSAQIVPLTATADLIGSSTVVGLRDLGEKLFGGTVDYNAANKTIKIRFTRCNGDTYTIDCAIGFNIAKITIVDTQNKTTVNDVTLPVAPIIIDKGANKKGKYAAQNNGRTMIPLRQLVEGVYGKTIQVNAQTVDTVGWNDPLKQATFTVIP